MPARPLCPPHGRFQRRPLGRRPVHDAVAGLGALEGGIELDREQFVAHLVPTSVFSALANNEILQIVTFSLFFGIAVTQIPGTEPLVRVIDKLAQALQAALKDPKVIERFADLGTEPVAQDRATPAALDQHLQAEIARWKPIIEAAGVYAD